MRNLTKSQFLAFIIQIAVQSQIEMERGNLMDQLLRLQEMWFIGSNDRPSKSRAQKENTKQISN